MSQLWNNDGKYLSTVVMCNNSYTGCINFKLGNYTVS